MFLMLVQESETSLGLNRMGPPGPATLCPHCGCANGNQDGQTHARAYLLFRRHEHEGLGFALARHLVNKKSRMQTDEEFHQLI